MLLMFGYLFGGGCRCPAGADYRELLLPGMFALTMVFGLEATMIAVDTDAATGITDRFRSMPMAPSAVVAGRSMADLLNSAARRSCVLLGCGLLVGWRAHNGVGDALLAVGAAAAAALRAALGGHLPGPARRQPGGGGRRADPGLAARLPLQRLRGARRRMPGWLGAIAEWNPLSATVAAVRELFGNPGWGGDSWAAQHALVLAVVWPVLHRGRLRPARRPPLPPPQHLIWDVMIQPAPGEILPEAGLDYEAVIAEAADAVLGFLDRVL